MRCLVTGLLKEFVEGPVPSQSRTFFLRRGFVRRSCLSRFFATGSLFPLRTWVCSTFQIRCLAVQDQRGVPLLLVQDRKHHFVRGLTSHEIVEVNVVRLANSVDPVFGL